MFLAIKQSSLPYKTNARGKTIRNTTKLNKPHAVFNEKKQFQKIDILGIDKNAHTYHNNKICININEKTTRVSKFHKV